MRRSFRQVDVFSATAYLGNPLAGRASPPYVASQGTALGRAGRVHVSRDAEGTIWVEGETVTCVAGEVDL